MAEERYNPHHSGNTPEQRIASRLRNSGCDSADHVIHKGGDAPNRVITNIHSHGQGGSARRVDLEKGGVKSGLGAPQEPDIHGNKRGVV